MSMFSDDRASDSKPISGLVSDALQQFSRLMRSEFALAKAELLDKGQTAQWQRTRSTPHNRAASAGCCHCKGTLLK
jgi:hypothetical protein